MHPKKGDRKEREEEITTSAQQAAEMTQIIPRHMTEAT